MNENEFEYDGKVLNTYTASIGELCVVNCAGCYFNDNFIDCFHLRSGNKIPQCIKSRRLDGIDVIFVEVKHE